jgi:hypothetical protein
MPTSVERSVPETSASSVELTTMLKLAHQALIPSLTCLSVCNPALHCGSNDNK